MQLIWLARTAQEQGDHAQARVSYQEGLALCRSMGDKGYNNEWPVWIAEWLEGVAGVACAQGRPERTAYLFGAAAALREVIDAPPEPVDRAFCEHTVAAARAVLGDDAFAAAWAIGQTWPLDQAIAAAEEVLVQSTSARQQPGG
jgi:hypothetical protein